MSRFLTDYFNPKVQFVNFMQHKVQCVVRKSVIQSPAFWLCDAARKVKIAKRVALAQK
ncbi:MAG: hypothetical protein J6Q33_05410 [Alistipes sp.]|nr:hypothetical protein [Alistipes sp.]